VFEGFLPRSGAERTQRIAGIVDEQRTVVLYEAPHRLEKTLVDLELSCGALRRVVLARELTKMHEEMWRGTLHDAVKHSQQVEPRGEYVVLLEGAKPPAPPTTSPTFAANTSPKPARLTPMTSACKPLRIANAPPPSLSPRRLPVLRRSRRRVLRQRRRRAL
jgi:16S rRNA C1402 (ribose-2'-O) methylase RsmI